MAHPGTRLPFSMDPWGERVTRGKWQAVEPHDLRGLCAQQPLALLLRTCLTVTALLQKLCGVSSGADNPVGVAHTENPFVSNPFLY